MVDYIRNIIIVGVVCSLAVTVLPKSAEKSGKYVKQLSAFVLLLVMLSPLKNISDFVTAVRESIGSVAVWGESGDFSYSADAVIGKSAETISKYIINICSEKFGIDGAQTRVKLLLDDSDVENVIIKEIQVFTTEGDFDILEEAQSYLAEQFQTKVYVFGA